MSLRSLHWLFDWVCKKLGSQNSNLLRLRLDRTGLSDVLDQYLSLSTYTCEADSCTCPLFTVTLAAPSVHKPSFPTTSQAPSLSDQSYLIYNAHLRSDQGSHSYYLYSFRSIPHSARYRHHLALFLTPQTLHYSTASAPPPPQTSHYSTP